ncbi:hypothetical protein TNCV_3972841 [Trichonephila clavipes]|nr:hypothetical protein TNCV_3972841 [Trichonephila clavipes]
MKRPPVCVVVRRGGASSDVIHVTWSWFKSTWSVAKTPRVSKQCDVNPLSGYLPPEKLFRKRSSIELPCSTVSYTANDFEGRRVMRFLEVLPTNPQSPINPQPTLVKPWKEKL